MRIGVQTKNVVYDDRPEDGFRRLKQAGFSCADFSLNGYLTNISLYQGAVSYTHLTLPTTSRV